MKLSELDSEIFWESMQNAGWFPRKHRLVSPLSDFISVDKNRSLFYKNIRLTQFSGNLYEKLLNFDENQQQLVSTYPKLLKFASVETQLAAVQQNGFAIYYIENPSEAVQLAAIRQDGYAIQFIEKPSEALQLAAVHQDGTAIQYIRKPSEAVKLAAVRQTAWAIEGVEDPSEAVQLAAVNSDWHVYSRIEYPTERVMAIVNRHLNDYDYYDDDDE